MSQESRVVGSVGLCFALFYAATGISVAVYYRELARQSLGNFVGLLIFPAASAVFLLWVAWKSIPGLGGWNGSIMHYLYVMMGIGIVLMFLARFWQHAPYFAEPREAYKVEETGRSEW